MMNKNISRWISVAPMCIYNSEKTANSIGTIKHKAVSLLFQTCFHLCSWYFQGTNSSFTNKMFCDNLYAIQTEKVFLCVATGSGKLVLRCRDVFL